MACGEKPDYKKINAEQWDLSTAKTVHYSTTSKPEGPTKGARTMPMTPVPGEDGRRSSDGRSSDAQSSGSPGGSSPTWKAGVEGETVQYKKSAQRNQLDDTVHHAVQDEIDKLIAENQNIDNTELRSKLKDVLQRELTNPELRKIQSLTTTGGNNEPNKEEAARRAEAEAKAARRATLAEMAEDSDDDEEHRKVGVRKEEWDADTQECHFCHKGFGFLRHRHHCRGCGRNACDSCSGETAELPPECGYGSSPQRICNECFSLLKFQRFQQNQRGKG